MKKDFYAELDNKINAWEKFLPSRHIYDLNAIADKIAWCYKFRKITHEQMEDLCSRLTKLFDEKVWKY